jgi:hypothetical protein
VKIGIRTIRVRTAVEAATPPGEASDERHTLPVRGRESGYGPRPEDLVMTCGREPYRPRHAADATEEPLDGNKAPADVRPGRHRG